MELWLSGKRADGFRKAFIDATDTELWQVYGSYSAAKARAMEHCKMKRAIDALKNCGASAVYIISHNAFVFTAAWVILMRDGSEVLRVETPKNSYIMYMEDWKNGNA